ncbi:hypothetical protein C4564_05215 [Candidatus Microgenomates bacterium]|nr:MAG: hypothetical protein C4564_05215 [Candidatus Microgenomates bacterium]
MSEDEALRMVEIGVMDKPVIRELRHDLVDKDGPAVYIDKRPWPGYMEGNPNYDAGRDLIIQADAQDIPLPESSSTIIVAKDMFGAEGKLTTEIVPGAGATNVNEHVGDRGLIAQEFFRVAAPGGKIVVLETLTPSESIRNSVENAMDLAGFKLAEEYKGRQIQNIFADPEHSVIKRNSLSIDWDNAYALVYEKTH